MRQQPSKKRYLKQMARNMDKLDAALQGGKYPALRQLFYTKKGKANSLYRKLKQLHSYLQTYEDDGLKQLEHIEPRGWEFMASLDTLVSLYKSNKETWRKALLKLLALQMVGRFIPRLDDEYAYLNSAAQQHSAERAKQAAAAEREALAEFGAPAETLNRVKRMPCTYYRLYPFTDKLLGIAEGKAAAVKKMGSGIDKNAIRDAFGKEQADRATDTAYDMDEGTDTRRQVLAYVLQRQLSAWGFTDKRHVIQEATEATQSLEPFRWIDTWKAYKPMLYADLDLKEGRPSKAEKQRWALDSDSWIIRRES